MSDHDYSVIASLVYERKSEHPGKRHDDGIAFRLNLRWKGDCVLVGEDAVVALISTNILAKVLEVTKLTRVFIIINESDR